LIDEIVKHGAHDGVKGGFLVKIPQRKYNNGWKRMRFVKNVIDMVAKLNGLCHGVLWIFWQVARAFWNTSACCHVAAGSSLCYVVYLEGKECLAL
jgi:hypothetical protein